MFHAINAFKSIFIQKNIYCRLKKISTIFIPCISSRLVNRPCYLDPSRSFRFDPTRSIALLRNLGRPGKNNKTKCVSLHNLHIIALPRSSLQCQDPILFAKRKAVFEPTPELALSNLPRRLSQDAATTNFPCWQGRSGPSWVGLSP